MKIKVNEASGRTLDYLVAKAQGTDFHQVDGKLCILWSEKCDVDLDDYQPSENWAQGGPIIERENTCLTSICPGTWRATSLNYYWHNGRTPLEAAMRSFVAGRLGEEVEVPDGLGDGIKKAFGLDVAQEVGK